MPKSFFLLLLCFVAVHCIYAAEPARDFTCFQTGSPYGPKIDVGSDVAVVYGTGADLPDRMAAWRAQGYAISMMTGIAWGGYDDYYMENGVFKAAEVQTRKNGKLFMHGDSTTVGYNVPTDAYIEYIKRKIEPAVDAGAMALYLEEPEFWAESGWSEAFKKSWADFYGEAWQEPDSSVDAQYRASKLKYEMYYKALREVFKHAKARASAQGRTVECHVPTHSLISYAQWRIVSPESHLMDIAEADGYIAQVWTGTARSANIYRGQNKERTFETGFLEYGQAFGMVRPTGRKVWFLADPVEDNPNRSWADYKRNYECTIIASLMWPEVSRFEVMPWPDRIFQGSYPKLDMDAKTGGAREGIPADYATQLLAVINALNDMNQKDIRYETGTRGIGVLVSDTMMFQRAAPQPSDPHLGSFFGLALPLVKSGIPAEPVQLETILTPNMLASYRVLLLTYEGQKPLKSAYHDVLAQWVRDGGGLIYVGDGSDPYLDVREWWNEQGKNKRRPDQDLFERLGITPKASDAPEAVGKGFVRVFSQAPRELQRKEDGASKVMALVQEMCNRIGEAFKTQNYLCVQRGPYVVASVLDESISEQPLVLKGSFIDIFNPALPYVTERTLAPGERTLLYDLTWLRKTGAEAKVIAAAARVKNESVSNGALRFVARGPKDTTGGARILLPRAPKSVTTTPSIPVEQHWDEASGTLHLGFGNGAVDISFEVTF